MKIPIVLLVFCCLVAGPTRAQEPPSPPDDAARAWADLQERYRERADWRGRWPEVAADAATFAARHVGTDLGLDAELFRLRHVGLDRRLELGTVVPDTVADALLAHYLASPRLVDLVDVRRAFERETRDRLFGGLYERSPHRAVRAAALFVRSLDQMHDGAFGMQEAYDGFEVLERDYGDVPWRHATFGALAHAYLNPHSKTDLEVGRVAPEIEGVNEAGLPLKLSDFRGKVVVLEFWGDW